MVFLRVPDSVRFFSFFVLFAFLFSPCTWADAPAVGTPKAKAAAPPDILVFSNGDRLTGKLVRAVGDAVVFHSDMVGELTVKWAQIRELHSSSRLAVLQKGILARRRVFKSAIPTGTLSIVDGLIMVEPRNGVTIPPIPLKRVAYIVDERTLLRQIAGHPGALAGWNGEITGGATIVQATQKQYTFTGAVSLTRVAPTVNWLNPHNRSTIDFSGSFGKIIQPAYMSGGILSPSSSSKSSIYHADSERDQYFSPRFYVLAQTAFDHNFAQALDLQQIYGAGIGWTAVKRPNQELDIKTTLQYEGQSFLEASAGQNQNLVGSTINGTWTASLPLKVQFKQELSWIPAYNNPYAYSGGETNSLTMPFFRRFAFSVGSIDSYLNDPPPAVPPTRRNSLQFTTGLTYAIKSKY